MAELHPLLAVIDTVEYGTTVAGVSYDGMQYFNATMDCNFTKQIRSQANRVGFWAAVALQVGDEGIHDSQASHAARETRGQARHSATSSPQELRA
jgi:hypothetical protein